MYLKSRVTRHTILGIFYFRSTSGIYFPKKLIFEQKPKEPIGKGRYQSGKRMKEWKSKKKTKNGAPGGVGIDGSLSDFRKTTKKKTHLFYCINIRFFSNAHNAFKHKREFDYRPLQQYCIPL